MEVISKSTEDTKRFTESLVKTLKPHDVLALYGDLGSGKTTFTRYIVESLKIPSRVQSPTFVVARKYFGGIGEIKNVNHVDLYRLHTKEEVYEIGLHELINEPNSITILEWPELAGEYLPDNVKKIHFEYIDENTRRINVQD